MIQEIHILYIDSDPLLLDIAKQFFEPIRGFTVTLTRSITDALILLAENHFDAILSEYELDTVNGIELLKRLRERGDTTPFLFFTGKGQEAVVIEALNNGADFYLKKEKSPSTQFIDLSNAIVRIVSRRRNEENTLKTNQETLGLNNCLSVSEEDLRSQLEKISEQESLLRISEERLLMAQEIGQTGCWEYTVDTNELWVSAEGCRIFGFPPLAGTISVEKVEACIPDYSRVRQAARDLIRTGHAYNLEYLIHPADGSPPKVIQSVARFENSHSGKRGRIIGIFHDITEHTSAETRLKEINEAFMQAQKIARVGSWMYDLKTNQITWSDELYRIFGHEPGSLSIQLDIIRKVIHPEDLEKHDQILHTAIQTNYYEPAEYRLRHPDGSSHYINADGTVEVDENGIAIRLIGVCQDITRQKQIEFEQERLIAELEVGNEELTATYEELLGTERELKKQYYALIATEELLNSGQRVAHLGSWEMNIQTEIFTWSDELFRILGYEPQSFVPQKDTLDRVVHPDDREELWKRVERAFDKKNSFEYEMRVIRQDGEIRTLFNQGEIHYDDEGLPVRMIGITLDITERKKSEKEQERLIYELRNRNEELNATNDKLLRTEEELRHQYNIVIATETDLRKTQEFLENLLSIANVPIVVWNPSFQITRLNHAFEELTGRAREEIIEQSIDILFPPEQTERNTRLLKTTQEGVRWKTVEIDILHQNGSIRTILWNSATLYSPDGVTPVATIAQGRDVTEERLLEKEKDIALVQIQKNLAQLAILNDEIRNPLTIIAAYVDMFDEPLMIEQIIAQVHRIDEIINHLDRRWIESEKVLNAIRKHYNLQVSSSLDPAELEYSKRHDNVFIEEIQAQLYTILDSIDALVYVADMETYELLFINQRGRARLGDIVGQKCYETIHFGQNEPCSFCTNHILVEKNQSTGVHQWEFRNPHNSRWYDCRDRAIRWTDGKLVRLEIATDITSIKEAEDNLRASEARIVKKLNALLLPEGDIGIFHLSDILDIAEIQILMDNFHSITGILVAILDLEGNILVSAGWQDICTKFHRINPDTCKNCTISDTILSKGVAEGTYKLYHCKNNMWDISTPIIIGGTHLGNLFLGQFFFDDEEVDFQFFIDQAKKYGFDEEEYLNALHKVPRFNRKTVDTVMQFYIRFIQLVTQLSWSNIKLARTVNERDTLIASVQENEEKFRSYINNAPDGIFVIDNEGHYLEVNPAANTITGFTREELVEKSILDILHPDSLKEAQDHFHTLIAQGKATGEFLFRHKDGSLRYMSVDAARISPIRFIGFVQDVSARKQVEESLKNSEARMHTLIHTIPDLIWLKDENGRYISCNAMFERFFGAQEKEISGKTDYDFVEPELANFFREHDRKAMEAGRPTRNEEWITFADDGHQALLETIKTPMYDDQGSLIGVLGIGRDITERQRMSEELREAHNIIERSPVVIFLMRNNELWSVEFVSQNVRTVFGYSAEDFISGTIHYRDVIHPEDRSRVMETDARFISDSETEFIAHAPYRIITRDGLVKWVDASTSIRRDQTDEITHYQGTIIDITDRIQGEEALHESNQKLRLLTGLTRHDIFNQVSTVQLLATLALQTPDLAKANEYIAQAIEASEKIEKTISFTREYEDFGIVSSGWQKIRSVVESAKGDIGTTTITIHNDIQDDLEVYADPIIRKVFTTLIDNAIRHGNTLTAIWFSAEIQNNGLIISCLDDGMGIPVEEKNLIFEHGFGKHTGIGLFLASEILSITGLSIRESGLSHEGARFEILVPMGKFRRVEKK